MHQDHGTGPDPWADYGTAVLDATLAPRLSVAAHALREFLADGEWHSKTVAASHAVRLSDCKHKTVMTMIGKLVKDGCIDRRQMGRGYQIRTFDW